MDYGLTESRYYLLLGGGLMTVCALIFLFRNRRGYFELAGLAFCVVSLTVLVPTLRGENVAMRSQVHRVLTLAQQLDRLNEDGTLRLPDPDPTDTLNMEEHRRLYQSLDYIGDNDTLLLKQEFGLAHAKDYLESLSKRTSNYASAWSEVRVEEVIVVEEEDWAHLYYNEEKPIDLTGYSRVYADDVRWYANFWDDKDKTDPSLVVGNNKILMDELLENQLHLYDLKDGVPSKEWLEAHANELLVYRTSSMLIVFEEMSLERKGEQPWRVHSATVSFVLEK